MLKTILAVVMITFAGSVWLALDYLNKQQQGDAQVMHQDIEKARATALMREVEAEKTRLEAKIAFERHFEKTLSQCQADADKAQSDYGALIEKIVPRKQGKASIPQAIADEATAILATAKVVCQQAYDVRIKSGV